MHYKNGREAKNGDKVVLMPSWGSPVVGILYDAVAGNDYCNGKLAPTKPSDPCPNLKEVLHLDDVLQAVAEVETLRLEVERLNGLIVQQLAPEISMVTADENSEG